VNRHVAQRLFDLLQQAEMAYHLNGVRHADYLKPYHSRAVGQLRRELGRIIALGDNAARFCDYFLKEFGA
jgi:hypothetical protein